MSSSTSPVRDSTPCTTDWLSLLAKIAARPMQDEHSIHFIDEVFADLVRPLRLDAYLYYQAERDQRTLALLAYRGIDEAIAERNDVLYISPATRQSVCVWPAAHKQSRGTGSQQLPNLGATLAQPVGVHLPLVVAGHFLGTLLLAGNREPFTAHELELLQAIGDVIASTLERGRLRYQLQTEHARFQVLLDHIPAAVLLADASSGRIVMGNPQAERILGRPVAADTCTEPTPAELPLLRALSGEQAQAMDYLFQRSDGTETWLRASGSPIRNPQGQVIGSLITCYDIDQEKRAEAALQDSKQIQLALVKADRSKDEFLAILGHELRNPLSAIGYAVSLLEMDVGDGESRQEFDLIRGQLTQISRLIEDLLDLSRVKQGKIDIQKQLIDLNDVMSRAIDATRLVFEQRQQTLEVSRAAVPLVLEADPARLEQVIVNLLNNAAKYSEPGQRIWLSSERSGDQALLKVRDNGIGMSPQTLASVFDLFSQDRAARQRSDGGLGIGLALVKALVTQHHGNVVAHSAGVGRGSELVVHLPLCTSVRQLPPQQEI